MKSFNKTAPKSKISKYQIRWNESLGKEECPYAYRWCFITPYFSIRVHRWLRSDDKRYMHDHPWSFTTIVLKGSYTDVSVENKDSDTLIEDKLKFLSIRKRTSSHIHYVRINKPNTYTLLFTSNIENKWAFFVNKKFYRPLRFFHRHGHPPCSES